MKELKRLNLGEDDWQTFDANKESEQ